MQHYRCFRVWATSTNAERITDTIVSYPHNYSIPHATFLDTTAVATYDLTQVLLRPYPPYFCNHCVLNLCIMLYYDWWTFKKIYILHQQQHTVSTDIPVNDFESSLSPLPITIPTESLSPPLPRVVPTCNPIASPPPIPPIIPTPYPIIDPPPIPSTTGATHVSSSNYKSKQM